MLKTSLENQPSGRSDRFVDETKANTIKPFFVFVCFAVGVFTEVENRQKSWNGWGKKVVLTQGRGKNDIFQELANYSTDKFFLWEKTWRRLFLCCCRSNKTISTTFLPLSKTRLTAVAAVDRQSLLVWRIISLFWEETRCFSSITQIECSHCEDLRGVGTASCLSTTARVLHFVLFYILLMYSVLYICFLVKLYLYIKNTKKPFAIF